jgi:hypothetical protein
MGDPNALDKTLEANEMPVVKKNIPAPQTPDPNETQNAAPQPGKATKKPLAVTSPFMPKIVDRVKTVKVGSAVTKTVAAVTEKVPAQMSKDGKTELRPAETIVVKPEQEVVVTPGGSGLLNGAGGPRDRTKSGGYKHIYRAPIKFMGAKKKAN